MSDRLDKVKTEEKTRSQIAELQKLDAAESLKTLEYFRREVSHEFSLLGTRVTWYVTCQSFLITAFVILIGHPSTWLNLRFVLASLIIALGLFTSLVSHTGIYWALFTIKYWLEQEDLIHYANEDTGHIDRFRLKRKDTIHSKNVTREDDKPHRQSLWFVKSVPIGFSVFWAILAILMLLSYTGWLSFN